MIRFLSLLFGLRRDEATIPDADPYEAAITLLVEAARIDGDHSGVESDVIRDILVNGLRMDPERAKTVLQKAADRAETVTSAHALTQQVKVLPSEERMRIIEYLYRVSLADGETCRYEDSFIRRVAGLLHVGDIARAHARKRAIRAASGPEPIHDQD